MQQVTHIRRLLVAQAIIAVAIIAGIVYEMAGAYYNALDGTYARATRTRNAIMAHSTQTFTMIDQALSNIVEHAVVIVADGPDILNQYLLVRRNDLPYVEVLQITDRNGTVIATTRPRLDYLGHRDFFAEHRDDQHRQLRISTPYIGQHDVISGKWVVDLTRPVFDNDGNFSGVAIATLSLEDMSQVYDDMRHTTQDIIGLVRDDGVLLARSPFAASSIGRQVFNAEGSDQVILQTLQGDYRRTSPIDGNDRVVAYGQIKHFPLMVYAGVSVTEALSLWKRRAILDGSLGILLGAMVMAFSYLLYRQIRKNYAADAARQQAQEETDRIFRSISDAVYRIDKAWRFTFLNRQAEQLFGQSTEDIKGKLLWDAFPALRETQTKAEFEHAIQHHTMADFEQYYAPTRTWFNVRAYPGLDGLTVYLQDITAKKVREEQKHEAQRMDTLGKLTGGVAHDFNNLLTVIIGNTELIAEYVQHDKTLRGMADTSLKAAERGAKLVSQLLSYARRQQLNPSPINIPVLLDNMKHLLDTAVGNGVRIRCQHAPDVWPALADEGRLQDALINLCINGRDAMPDGGTITISTSNLHVTPDMVKQGDALAKGDYVAISVRDTGVGMDKNTLKRVFDPFFTTKDVGKGSGLGLPMVQGFARQSNGSVGIESTLGKGTTITLYLPRASSIDTTSTHIQSASLPTGKEKILLVEDEPLVKDHVGRLLKSLGYDLLCAGSGAQALQLLMAHNDIDLLFTDVTMPGGMSGPELAREARLIYPELPVLFTSGYPEQLTTENYDGLDSWLLEKPYNREQLARKIREALGAGPHTPTRQ
ncbi:ATP-binding protein [Pusillimonas sp. T2]|uniref:ATP-binding protein n=1 Tax=Pusillimonas sp. T2 TaxID=1548123 RepID=UPI001302EE7F|nr:ATP-binding protein [Pusillimonas sp. T2]